MDILAAAGASVSISPASEMRIGFGLTKVAEFLDHKVNLALSVDTTPLTGNADMFGIMKLVQNLENGRSESEFKLPARKVIELATIEGAKALGLADRAGSLRKGKRADVIMVGTREVNIGPFTEPAYMLVDSAQASNVDTVFGARVTANGSPAHNNQSDRAITANSMASAISPAMSGALLSIAFAGLPLVLCGVLKMVYERSAQTAHPRPPKRSPVPAAAELGVLQNSRRPWHASSHRSL
jgi:cytosine/adenosine deaminase-related metal-dependent hydrolase